MDFYEILGIGRLPENSLLNFGRLVVSVRVVDKLITPDVSTDVNESGVGNTIYCAVRGKSKPMYLLLADSLKFAK